jgi:2,5-furandicarboxylate decarboxylase 1
MDMRAFLEGLEESGDLLKRRGSDPKVEIADTIFKENKPILFEGLGDYRLVSGICMDRELIARYMGIKKEELLFRIADALDKPIEPEIVSEGACQEEEEGEVDLEKIPILQHYPKDDGAYITAGLFFVKNEDGSQNVAYHRAKRIGKDKLVARICERDTFKCMAAKGGTSEVAICLGNTPSMLIAASTSLKGVDETKIAGALDGKPLKLVRCKTVDINVPADCEIVLEGTISFDEKVQEGKFVDMTGTYDAFREQPVVTIKKITHRKDPIYQAIVPGKTEHRLLMGMPKEPTIYKAVKEVVDCKNVNLTPGGCSWLHCVVQIKQRAEGDGKKAIEATFNGHKSLKHVVVVDEDIDLFDPNDVEWAITTRFQAHRDLVIMEGQPGSSLDPSAEEDPNSDRRLTTKWGIDATIPWGAKRDEFLRAAQLQAD